MAFKEIEQLAHRYQNGVALVLTLTILLILTLIGVASIQTTSMQERMSRNFRDANMAFQAAEAAIAEAETYIERISTIDSFPEEPDIEDALSEACSAGLCTSTDGRSRWQQSNGVVDWSDSSTYIESTTVLGSQAQSKYVVEYVAKVDIEQDTLNIGNVGEGGTSGRSHVFRVTARGIGGTTESTSMIQSLYGRQF